MISLLLTLFVCLFSYCPSVNTIEDHEENIITINESKPVSKSYIIEDSQGAVTYFLFTDLSNPDFIRTFIEELPMALRMGFTEMTLNSYTFEGVGASVWSVNDTGHMATGLFDINKITVQKYSITPYTYQNIDYTNQVYHFRFYWNDTQVFRCEYRWAVPFVTNNDNDIGIQCIGFGLYKLEFNNSRWVYIENNKNGGFNPLTTYGYYPYATNYGDSNSYNAGYNYGYSQGYTSGYDDGNSRGLNVGYQNGYTAGYTEGTTVDDTASTIFTGILDVALVPVNVFLSIFNFEVFGINIGGVVSGLLTLSVVIIILRFLFGGKKDD